MRKGHRSAAFTERICPANIFKFRTTCPASPSPTPSTQPSSELLSAASLAPMAARDTELQIVLIGKSRVGKSATGNTILGKEAFRSMFSSAPVTRSCQRERGEFEEQKLMVVDTPGLFGNRHDRVVDKIKSSVFRGLPVVFLVVLQLGTFTEEEIQIVRIIQNAFGEEAKHLTMALFTRGDDLKTEERSVDEFIGENPALRDLVSECGGGYHVFDNKDDTDGTQVPELLQRIKCMMQRSAIPNIKGDEGNSVMEAIVTAVVGVCAVGVMVFIRGLMT